MALQPLNQFGQLPVVGMLDLQSRGGNTITAQVSNNITSGGTLVPGQPVKFDTANSGGVLKVLPLAANTDFADGFVIYTLKDQSFPVDAKVEIAFFGSVMYMNSNAAIARNQRVEVVQSNSSVTPALGLNPVIGWAMDDATGSGQLIRVYITTEANSRMGLMPPAQVTVTLAQLNAGLVLIPGTAGKKILVTDFTLIATGTLAGSTAVVLESTNATPVVVVTELAAAFANGDVVKPTTTGLDASQTLGAGFCAPLGSGDGLQIGKTGSTGTGLTNIAATITYSLV